MDVQDDRSDPGKVARHGLGGRLPLLGKGSLHDEQGKLFHSMGVRMEEFADQAGFAADDGRGHFIGPFNAMLYSPVMGSALQAFWLAEGKATSLTGRVRQVVILSVGSVWRAPYELYAHSAAGRTAGLTDDAIAHLVAGQGDPSLDETEEAARRITLALAGAHRVDDRDYLAAERVLGRRALVDIVVLAGSYGMICGLLNLFDIPAPGSAA